MLAVKLKSAPTHRGELLPAVGAVGVWFTVPTPVPYVEVQPLVVAVTEYVPDASVVAAAIVGFCDAEVKLLGPVHEYVVPVEVAVKLRVLPEQIVLLLPTVGAVGVWFTVTDAVLAVVLVHPLVVAVTE